jgi:hypothetical protein
MHKEEIEEELGTTLVLARDDDIKVSKVYFHLDNVSIKNEKDWLKMARFHAEWSKKFYAVFVPFLN